MSDQDCSSSGCDWFARYDPATSSWKTSQPSLLERTLVPYSGPWPKRGTMRNGTCWGRGRSALRTGASAGSSSGGGPNSEGLWPTPTQSDHATRFQQGGMPLGMAARMNWPTPRTTGLDGGSNSRAAAKARGMWPTPCSCSAMAAAITPESAHEPSRFPNLETVVGRRTWATPTANTAKNTGPNINYATRLAKGHLGGQMWEAEGVGGSLNPTWVEWLMGFPIGWTASAASGTPSSPSAPTSSD